MLGSQISGGFAVNGCISGYAVRKVCESFHRGFLGCVYGLYGALQGCVLGVVGFCFPGKLYVAQMLLMGVYAFSLTWGPAVRVEGFRVQGLGFIGFRVS